MLLQYSPLPLDVIRETLNHLPGRDLLNCQRVNENLRQMVSNSNELQLRMHLEQDAIQPAVTSTRSSSHQQTAQMELERLRTVEDRLSKAAYDGPQSRHTILQLAESNPEAMHLISIADNYVFAPWNYEGSIGGMLGIARYRIDRLDAEPEILQLDRPIRHFQVHPAEGVLLVVSMVDEMPFALRTYQHSLQMYSIDTLKPHKFHHVAEFSAAQICHPMSHMHIRGDLLVVTCENIRGREGTLGFNTQLINWNTGDVVLSRRIDDVYLVIPRILSTKALAILEVRNRSATLQILACDSNVSSAGEEGSGDVVIASYALPTVAQDRVYLTAYMECSALSLSARSEKCNEHHLLVDGEGILTITLETLYVPVRGPREQGYRPDPAAWSTMTAVALIKSFHDEAAQRNAEPSTKSSSTRKYRYEEWAPGNLSWLLSHPARPSRNAICGSRLLMPGDVYSRDDDPAIVGGARNRQKINIYDFNPSNVKKARCSEVRGKTAFRLSETLNILDLHTAEESTKMAAASAENDYGRLLVTRSGPAVTASTFEFEIANYATESPYISTTKRLGVESSSSVFIGQLAHGLLLLTHMTGTAREFRVKLQMFVVPEEGRDSAD
ncbi:hypothetical protein QFC21_000813 [Naganishia friedmannii]|uniref:Uncharacterized protein n=1 Tax=Naganishia friedmannii TaxID=89922 RepID=A0ACC2W6L2_9TREE|nr:hypothetical protein QFC21_000813 [Naganishia friedmannii]